MAIRPAFLPVVGNENNKLTNRRDIEFQWYPGFSQSQKQKSIKALHTELIKKLKVQRPLEISSKSPLKIGIELSAFNLLFDPKNGITVECAYQASKVFKKGGPYKDILNKSSINAKKDQRLKTSGDLLKFQYGEIEWNLEPKTLFYDWLYLTALSKNPKLCDELIKYDAFTDIEFNPSKSINCQANSAAMFITLKNRNLDLSEILQPDKFRELYNTKKPQGYYNLITV